VAVNCTLDILNKLNVAEMAQQLKYAAAQEANARLEMEG